MTFDRFELNRILGLYGRKGALHPGFDADVAVLERGAFRFNASATRDGLNWSPYDGETFAARIAATYLRGRKVFDGTDVIGAPGDLDCDADVDAADLAVLLGA